MLRMLHGVVSCAIRFGRRQLSVSAASGQDISRVDLVDEARRILSARLRSEYVKAWIDGRRAVFVDSWVYQSSLCECDSRQYAPFDLVKIGRANV